MTTDAEPIAPVVPETDPALPLYLAGTLKAFSGDYARSEEVAALVMESVNDSPVPGTWQECYTWLADLAREADAELRLAVGDDTIDTSP